MTAHEYLEQVYMIDCEVRQAMLLRSRIQTEIEDLRRRGGGGRLETLVQAKEKREREIIRLAKQIEKKRNRIMSDLARFAESGTRSEDRKRHNELKELLFRRYILFQKWETIAADMGFEVRYVYKMRRQALKEFEKFFEKSKRGQ